MVRNILVPESGRIKNSSPDNSAINTKITLCELEAIAFSSIIDFVETRTELVDGRKVERIVPKDLTKLPAEKLAAIKKIKITKK